MKVLMLGWEYPPHIAGGLGTACEGLTDALARQGIAIDFVMPSVSGDEVAPHMRLIDAASQVEFGDYAELGSPVAEPETSAEGGPVPAPAVARHRVPAALRPYWSEAEYVALAERARVAGGAASRAGRGLGRPGEPKEPHGVQYAGDIFSEVAQFTERALHVCRGLQPDVIHAHDWMTFSAGVALREVLRKPLVVHVHSLEYDRSGEHAMNPRIQALERLGIVNADAVVAVSHYTKTVICRLHGVPEAKVRVVHNGVYPKPVRRHYQAKHPTWPTHVVLFLGRVTFQKGPNYFVQAAAKVVPHVPDVLFVMAGEGDMLGSVKKLVQDYGLNGHFHFPGFLRGTAVEEMFSVADLYVMPSVSEPFGISALEAISFDVPVLLTKQSGVAEVVGHSLKFDFWDVNRLADLIVNGLKHSELRADMIEMARKELGKVRWDAAASKTIDLYHALQK